MDFYFHQTGIAKHGIASMDGDNIVTERGKVWTVQEFLNNYSKDRFVNGYKDSYEVTSEEYSQGEEMTAFGAVLADNVELHAVKGVSNYIHKLSYVAGDFVIKSVSEIVRDNYYKIEASEIIDTNLLVKDEA